jgi:hypothetical protein
MSEPLTQADYDRQENEREAREIRNQPAPVDDLGEYTPELDQSKGSG